MFTQVIRGNIKSIFGNWVPISGKILILRQGNKPSEWEVFSGGPQSVKIPTAKLPQHSSSCCDIGWQYANKHIHTSDVFMPQMASFWNFLEPWPIIGCYTLHLLWAYFLGKYHQISLFIPEKRWDVYPLGACFHYFIIIIALWREGGGRVKGIFSGNFLASLGGLHKEKYINIHCQRLSLHFTLQVWMNVNDMGTSFTFSFLSFLSYVWWPAFEAYQ